MCLRACVRACLWTSRHFSYVFQLGPTGDDLNGCVCVCVGWRILPPQVRPAYVLRPLVPSRENYHGRGNAVCLPPTHLPTQSRPTRARPVLRGRRTDNRAVCATPLTRPPPGARSNRVCLFFLARWKEAVCTKTAAYLRLCACDRCNFPSQPTGCTNAVMMCRARSMGGKKYSAASLYKPKLLWAGEGFDKYQKPSFTISI